MGVYQCDHFDWRVGWSTNKKRLRVVAAMAESKRMVFEVTAVGPSGLRVIATMAESKRVVCEVTAVGPSGLRVTATIAE
jgi:hypothetical protein